MTTILDRVPVGTTLTASDRETYRFEGQSWVNTRNSKIAKKEIARELELRLVDEKDKLSQRERIRLSNPETLRDLPKSPGGDEPGTKKKYKGRFYVWLGGAWVDELSNKIASKPASKYLNNKKKADNPFDAILANPKKPDVQRMSQQAMQWYFQQTKKFGQMTPEEYMKSRSEHLKPTSFVGHMYMYNYDAKHKDTLPYWDRWPLIFMMDFKEDGWLGINFHYLDPQNRARLLARLWDFSNTKELNEKTRLKLSYGFLKGVARYKAFKPCIKRYLDSHVRSRLLKVPPTEWQMAIFLPLQRFEKASDKKVWADSRQKMNQ